MKDVMTVRVSLLREIASNSDRRDLGEQRDTQKGMFIATAIYTR